MGRVQHVGGLGWVVYVAHPYLAYFLLRKLKHDYIYTEPIEVSFVLIIEVTYGDVDKCSISMYVCYEINCDVYSMYSVFSFLCCEGDCE